MVRQLEREVIQKYSWLERANITSGYGVNLLFDFADLDELCKDIEGELDAKSIGAGFLSQGQRIDEFAEHRCSLLTYINDVLYDIDNYLEDPLYKGFNEAVDIMATIDMTDGKTDNTLGVQKNVNANGGGRGYGFEVEMPNLNLEDFIGSRYGETEGGSYERSTYNQKVDDFADLFAKDYEDLVNSGNINSEEKSLQKYLDELILREFAHKKDSPFWKELLEQLSDLTIVIPIYEAATGKTLITGDYLTDTEGAFKLVSATVSLVTLGQGALASKGGVAFAKMFAAEVVSEAAAGTTVIVCDKAGVPSAVTISLALLLGTTAGMAANKALIPEDFSKWMTKEEASRYNQYWSDVQGRQGLKDYKYYSVLEDGFYKDLTVDGKYKNFDFSAFEGSGQKIDGGSETVTYRRVQGGAGTKSSQQRVIIDDNGNVYINKKDKDLNISIDNGEHSQYYVKNKRPGADIYEFEVPTWFDDIVQEYTIPQAGNKKNPFNQGGTAPKLTDPTTPGKSIEFPAPWSEWIEEYATKGRIIKGGH